MDCITYRNDLKYCFIIALILIIPASVSAFNPILSGERNLGQDYQFTVKNVTGLNQNLPGSDVTYHWSVYDYRLIGTDYNYYSVNWGRWFQQDADPGKQFLIIWVRSEMTGKTSWYGWGPERFRVWVWGNTTVYNQTTPMQDLPIEYKSDQYRPVVISEVQNLMSREKKPLTREWYGWRDEIELDRQEPGHSAAWDGMILYQIPEAATPDDIRIMGYSWYGDSVWYLTPHNDLIQEKQRSQNIVTITPTEKETPIIRGADPKPKPSPRTVR